jgi:vacuolar-type H+-ATPase subunit E/Vma4
MIALLPNAKPRRISSILQAMSHILKHAPELLQEIGQELVEIIEEISTNPDVASNEDLSTLIRRLQLDLMGQGGDSDE